MAGMNFNPGNGDGVVWFGDATWSVAHDSTSGNANTTSTTDSARARFVAGSYFIDRCFIPIDTSGLPSNCSIKSASLAVYVDASSGADRDLCLVQTFQASPTALVSNDYDNVYNTEGASRQTVTTTGWITFILNDIGLTWINKGGYTLFGIRDGKDVDNIAPIDNTGKSVRLSEYADATTRPILTINFDPIGLGVFSEFSVPNVAITQKNVIVGY